MLQLGCGWPTIAVLQGLLGAMVRNLHNVVVGQASIRPEGY